MQINIPVDSLTETENRKYITKWNWNYGECLEFQKMAVSFVKENPKQEILIATNHPACFTYGRGLQTGISQSLIDIDPQQLKTDYPLYKISRGGGLTFHHQGQWIFYPILNLNRRDLQLKNIIYGLLVRMQKILEKHFSITALSSENKLLGLWKGSQKLASMGIAIERFVTLHGVAMNVYPDHEFLKEVARFNPCGLSFSSYTHLNDHVSKDFLIDIFNQTFTQEWENDPEWYKITK